MQVNRPNHSTQERYVNIREDLKGYNGDKIELAVDSYELPFKLNLPKQIPSSIETMNGNIRYYVMVTIDRPLKVDDVSTRYFTVVSPVDLNENPQAQVLITL